MHGLNVIGIQGIGNFLDKKINNLHADIISLISVCRVKNIVFLFDGDCLDFSPKHLEKQTELLERPRQFYSAIVRFKQFLDGFDNLNVYFAHVNSANLKNKPKGLDDLLVSEKGNEKKVTDDILHLGNNGIYFCRICINNDVGKRLRPYFHLLKAQDFYDFHAEKIGEISKKIRLKLSVFCLIK
jgi:hypothetical protein